MTIVKWWKVVATPLYDDIANDDAVQTFYMRSAKRETASQEVTEAMLADAYSWDEYGPHDVRIDSVREVKQPPSGALYQMVESSRLF